MTEKPLLRWSQVVQMVAAEGISETEFRKLKEAGVVTPIYLRPNSRAYYSRDEVRRNVLEKGTTQQRASGGETKKE